MLASLAVSAAAIADTETDTAIEFRVPGGEDGLPTAGIHNPGPIGQRGVEEEEEEFWPEWVEGLNTWSLCFGEHDIPEEVGVVTYTTDGTTLDWDDEAVEDTLGILLQLAFEGDDGNVVSMHGEFELQAELGAFEVDGSATLQGFDLELLIDGNVRSRPAGLEGGVEDIMLVQSGEAIRAAMVLAGVWGWEWTGVLEGVYDGTNISAGQAQADITWTVIPHVEPSEG